jgi:hypothetical protein
VDVVAGIGAAWIFLGTIINQAAKIKITKLTRLNLYFTLICIELLPESI